MADPASFLSCRLTPPECFEQCVRRVEQLFVGAEALREGGRAPGLRGSEPLAHCLRVPPVRDLSAMEPGVQRDREGMAEAATALDQVVDVVLREVRLTPAEVQIRYDA